MCVCMYEYVNYRIIIILSINNEISKLRLKHFDKVFWEIISKTSAVIIISKLLRLRKISLSSWLGVHKINRRWTQNGSYSRIKGSPVSSTHNKPMKSLCYSLYSAVRASACFL